MGSTPELLTHDEHCNREGMWARDWRRSKIDFHELLQTGIKVGLTSDREDFGEAAGECVMGISAEREIISDQQDLYSQVIHYASIADVVSSAVRKAGEPPWQLPEPVKLGNGPLWTSAAFLAPSGTSLRRVVLVSNWSDDRHYSEARGWFSLGEICAYNLPMQQAVIILGQNRDGRRHGYWTRGYRHPANKKLRFRKRHNPADGFKDTWRHIWREDFDDIPTSEWLEVMLQDGVLEDVCFSVTIPLPEKAVRQRIIDLASQKMERIATATELPEQCLSVCDWPVPCIFRSPCHSQSEPNGRYGFIRITV